MSTSNSYSGGLEEFEERADHLPEEDLAAFTAKSDFFNTIHKALVSRGTKLIAGPRGSGKTHLMRFTYISCKDDKRLPLCLYVSFNRYLRLEPFLTKKADAIDLFHTWVLSRILLSLVDWIKDVQEGASEDTIAYLVGAKQDSLERSISSLERGSPADLIDQNDISLSKVIEAIQRTASYCGRKRSVVLFDDAALTLTPEYMQELFDVIRSIKTPAISPKASVYPGTTEYGPRFHVNHEADLLSVWLPISSPDYSSVMGEIAKNRAHDISSIPPDVVEYIKYASFGIPRAFLVMLREFNRRDFKTSQQGINKIIQDQNKWRSSEYSSLSIKVPKFQSLIEIGDELINKLVSELKKSNHDLRDKNEVQFNIGLSEIERPLEKRMLSLLVEAGMLYEHSSVSHGEDRKYQRFTPHLSILIERKVFPGNSIRSTVEFLSRKPAKHPIRRTLDKLIGADGLKLDISPCSKCDTPRLNESQKFCHHCGAALVDESTFERCMSLDLKEVTHLTNWQKEKVKELKIKKIGDFLALQDPGTELRKLHRIGSKRASDIIGGVDFYVDEFLS